MKLLSLAAAGLVACSGSTAATPREPSYAAKVDALAQAALHDDHAAGLSIAIAQHGKLVVAKGYGLANVERNTPADADTVYRIGSITKQFTAVAILQLVEAGQLHLSDDIRRYVPALPERTPAVTIDHLLHQTSGIPSYTNVPDWLDVGAKPMTRDELVARFANLPLAFPPGTRWEYSNSNYYLLGLVIEAITKRPYADVIHDKIFVPAGMTSSAYCADTLPHMAAGYTPSPAGPKPSHALDLAHPYAAGALCSTATDLVAWQRSLEAGKLVRPATLAQMRTSGVLADGSLTNYGDGVFVGDVAGHKRIGHGGGINGFTSMLARYPDDDLTIAVLANAETGIPDRLEQQLARLVLGLPEPRLVDVPMSAAERARYVGTYSVQGFGATGLEVQVTLDGDKLHIQAPAQPQATLVHQGNGAFVLAEDPGVSLTFHAEGFTLHQGGMTIEARRQPPRDAGR